MFLNYILYSFLKSIDNKWMCFQQWIQKQIKHHHQNQQILKKLLVYKELISHTKEMLSARDTGLV